MKSLIQYLKRARSSSGREWNFLIQMGRCFISSQKGPGSSSQLQNGYGQNSPIPSASLEYCANATGQTSLSRTMDGIFEARVVLSHVSSVGRWSNSFWCCRLCDGFFDVSFAETFFEVAGSLFSKGTSYCGGSLSFLTNQRLLSSKDDDNPKPCPFLHLYWTIWTLRSHSLYSFKNIRQTPPRSSLALKIYVVLRLCICSL